MKLMLLLGGFLWITVTGLSAQEIAVTFANPSHYTISVKNNTKSVMEYTDPCQPFDGVNKDFPVPLGVYMVVRDNQGYEVPKGYSWADAQNQMTANIKRYLGPGESLSKTYDLKNLAIGLFDYTPAKRANAAQYQIKLSFTLYGHEKVTQKAETEWIKMPNCVTADLSHQ